MLEWIKLNTEWLFSGLGVVLLTSFASSFALLFRKLIKNIPAYIRIVNEKKKTFSFHRSLKLLTRIIMTVAFSSFFALLLNNLIYKQEQLIQNDKVLTDDEERIISEYIERTSVEDGIGQIFMVGVPADFNNFKEVKDLDDIITRFGIGNIIVNGYNFYNSQKYNDTTFFDALIVFINALQDKSTNSSLSLPLLLATDFESSSFSSIRSGLISPPSALSIGAARNKDLAYENGALVGVQLSTFGIVLLLGPVLDSYNIKQSNRSTLQDRCFAGSPNGVVSISSNFIKGLRENGLHCIGKHFPNYGSIEENPHDPVIPSYEGL